MTELTTATDLIAQHDQHPEDVRERATALVEADEQWASGKTPRSLAAASIYLAYRLERPWLPSGKGTDSELPSQQSLAYEFDTTAMTLRKRLDRLRELAAENAED